MVCLLAVLLVFSLSACIVEKPKPVTIIEEQATDTSSPQGPTEGPTEEPTEGPTEGPVETSTPEDLGPMSPLLWKVTDKDGHYIYLFGTIHCGDKRNQRVLERVSGVLKTCAALAVEVDMLSYSNDQQRMMEDLTQYVLTDGSAITDHMPPEMYRSAYELLNRAGLFPSAYVRYNLAMWAQLVDAAASTLYGGEMDSEKAMDLLLVRYANKKNIKVLEVESSTFQMELLNSFDDMIYLMMIESTLETLDTYGQSLMEMYESWLSGDKDAFWSLLTDEMITEDDIPGESGIDPKAMIALIEDYTRKMLQDRNYGMRDRALEYLAEGKPVFFAVGAAHMANEEGLVQLLTDAGCSVEQVSY